MCECVTVARRGEGVVERYLDARVRGLGGTTRKWVSPGHNGVPDRIVLWPTSIVHFVETKARDGELQGNQEREHKRLRDLGNRVEVLHTRELVDNYIEQIRKDHLWIFRIV